MKKNITLFFFAIVSVNLWAQVPGYMGKRFSIGYSNYFAPRIPSMGSVFSYSYSGNEMEMATNRSFNYTNCIDVDYILNSKISLCVATQFSKMDFCKYGSYFSLYNYSSGVSSDIYYSPPKGKNMDLKTTNFSIGFKFFKKRYENPLGRYRKMELILVNDKVLMDKNEFYYDLNYPYAAMKYTVPDAPYKYKSVVFAYTMGKQRVLFDKIVLDYGLRIGLNCNYFLRNGSIMNEILRIASEKTNEDITLDTQLKEAANIRISQSQFINAHLGFRFLAF